MADGSGNIAEVGIALEGARADERTLELLMDELSALSGARVERATEGEAPEGSKALGLEAMGLLLKVGKAIFPEAVKLIGDWLGRQPSGTKLRFKFEGVEVEWEGGKPPKEILDLLAGQRGA